MNKKNLIAIAILAGGIGILPFATSSEKQVDYSNDLKPIINRKCITCHGGVKAKSGFSLLFREDALAKAESGKYAIVPGKPEQSELIRRINATDAEERMPYKHPALSEEEIGIFTRWIKQGAKWGDHWAYLPVKSTPVPVIKSKWISNDVDAYILDKLNEQQLKPSAIADKPTLLRRVSLDLIGQYPSEKIARAYLTSNDPHAYEILVDSLLSSPHYGERWAQMWLDIARYADSKGYEADYARKVWRYRDWVIKAFNQDKPYNEFVKEQIAGDLFPNPTDDQYIATAFSRNSMTNDEGGTDNEEFRTSAVLDRVNTTWQGLMGTTFGCVQCHSHPYDPFRHSEFYSFVAYFNNTRDEDTNPEEYPYLRSYSGEQRKQADLLMNWLDSNATKQEAASVKLFLRTWEPAVNASTSDSIKNGYIAGNNSALFLHNHSMFRIKNIDLNNVKKVIIQLSVNQPGKLAMHIDHENGAVIGSTNLRKTKQVVLETFPIVSDNKYHDIYITFNNPDLTDKKHSKDVAWFEWVAFTPEFPGKGKPRYEQYKKMYWELLNQKVETTPVMVENPAYLHRTTHVFERGNRLTPGEEVKPSVPKSLAYAMPKGAPENRLGLADWLVDKRNPLVSRTIVNRLWEQLFGTGIVETLDDLGTQGIPPTHREMLDHYAWKLMNEYKWSIKKMLREFVLSTTYRQQSKFSELGKDKDPENKYCSHGPRVRLSAEQLRDQHLCISGMMSEKMFGPSVMPWQPPNIWSNPYNSERWKTSEGEDQYRRALYTYIKRTGTYPSMVNFDATSRIVCTARRIRTNTPLQALVLLNDSVYTDLATHFAERMEREAGPNVHDQIAKGYEIMLYKKIQPSQLNVLLKLYEQGVESFNRSDSSAIQFLGYKKGITNKGELNKKAALKIVANAMMNLDEVITKN